jgi:hypothetical protein
MQLYWDVPAGGNWWNTVSTKVTAWSNAGIGSIWLPPVSKAQNGPFLYMILLIILILETTIKMELYSFWF